MNNDEANEHIAKILAKATLGREEALGGISEEELKDEIRMEAAIDMAKAFGFSSEAPNLNSIQSRTLRIINAANRVFEKRGITHMIARVTPAEREGDLILELVRLTQPVDQAEAAPQLNLQGKIKIGELVNSGSTHPTQWSGITDDMRKVYIRYRHGELTVNIGEPGDMSEFAGAGGYLAFSLDYYDPRYTDGDMPYATLKELLKEGFEMPAEQVGSSLADREEEFPDTAVSQLIKLIPEQLASEKKQIQFVCATCAQPVEWIVPPGVETNGGIVKIEHCKTCRKEPP